MFPNAKFIHIHRNPVIVFLSTMKFFEQILPTLTFQKYKNERIREIVLSNYEKLMSDYWETYQLIPAENLIEVKFEQFMQDPASVIKNIYKKFSLSNYDQTAPVFEKYLDSQKSHLGGKHRINKEELHIVMERWGFAMEKLGYEVPKDVSVQ